MINLIKKWFYHKDATPLPLAAVGALFIIVLFNSMTITMVFPFLPKLVKSFGYSETEIGYHTGTIASSMFIGRAVFSLLWGVIADAKGKKKTMMFLLAGLTLATLFLAFSYSLKWTVVSRILQGCFMGVLVISKSVIADVCDDTNSALGMTIVASGTTTGLIIGPSIGAFLAFPVEQYPNVFSSHTVFARFVILLPNLVIVGGLVVGMVLVFKYVPRDKKKVQPNEEAYLISSIESNNTCYGTSTFDDGEQIQHTKMDSSCKYSTSNSTNKTMRNKKILNDSHTENFRWIKRNQKCNISKTFLSFFRKERLLDFALIKVMRSKEFLFSSILYGVYSMVAVAYDELFTLYSTTYYEFGGTNFSPSQIGTVMLIVSSILIVLQFLIVSKISNKLGLVKTLTWSFLVISLYAPLSPIAGAIKNKYGVWIFSAVNLLLTRFALAIAYVAFGVMINNSVEPDYRATANGLGITASNIGRMVAPIIFGSTYSWSLTQVKGVKENVNPVGFPFNQYFAFFVLALLSIVSAFVASRLPKSLEKMKKSSAGSTKSKEVDNS